MALIDRKRFFLYLGLFLTLIWTILVAAYIGAEIGWGVLAQVTPGEQGGLLAGYAGVLAFLWVFLTFLKRDRQLAAHMASLEAELHRLRDPLGESDAKTAGLAEALRKRVELVEAATTLADSQLAKATALLESQSQGIVAAAAKVTQEVELAKQGLSQQRGQLEDQSNQATRLLRQQMESMTAAAAEMMQRVEAELAEKAAAANRLFEGLVEQGQKLQGQMQTQLTQLSRAASEAGRTSDWLRESLKGQSSEAEAVAERIAGEAATMITALSGASEILTVASGKAGAEVAEVSTRLEEEARRIAEATNQATASLTGLLGEASTRLTGLSGDIDAATAQATTVAEAYHLRAQELGETVERERARIEAAGQVLRTEAQSILAAVAEAYRRRETDFAAASERERERIDNTGAVMREEAASMLASVAEAYHQHGIELQQATERERGRIVQISEVMKAEAGLIIEAVSEAYRRGSADLAATSERERQRMAASAEALRADVEGLRLLIAGTLTKEHELAEIFRDRTDEIGRKIDQNDTRVEALRDSVAELSRELATAAGEVERRSQEASFAFRDEGQMLIAAAEEATTRATAARTIISGQMAELIALAERSGELAQNVHDMLVKPIADLNAAAALAEGKAGDARADVMRLSEEVEAQVRRLLDTAQTLRGEIAGLGGEIEAKSKIMVGAADEAIRNVGGLDARVEEQAGRMTKVLGEALDRAADLGQLLKTQSETLNRATLAAKAEVEALGDARSRARNESFLAIAASIVAELGTLSIDITSLLDSEIPPEVWKRYRSGDRSAFVRRLLNKKDAYLLPALNERYQKDLKLRDLVLRFTGKFEELIESANKADPDNVLTTAFLTADIGKLYLLIQRNLGKVAAQ